MTTPTPDETGAGPARCPSCGQTELQAQEPELIRRTEHASIQGRPTQRWALRSHRPKGGYRSRYGQEPTE
jgi:hypothetical protein